MSVVLFVLMASMQQAPAKPPATPPATPAAAPRRAAAPAPATTSVQVRVTDRSGAPASGAQVTAEGPSSRDGMTDDRGLVTLLTLAPGTYRLRASHEGLVTLEKEVALRTGSTAPVEFALSAAPPPPPPPEPVPAPAPPPPAPVAPAPAPAPDVQPGPPRVLSLLDLAEKSLSGRDPVRHVPIGCSGLGMSELLVIKETAQLPARPDADVALYVIAGEGTLRLAEKDQSIAPGWFSIVPRGSSSTIAHKGRTSATILLSVVSGPACGAPATEAARR